MNDQFNFFAIIVVLICAVSDIRFRLIPNRAVYPAIAGAVTYHTLLRGYEGTIYSLTGLFSGIALLVIPFLLRWMGAGDAKLLGFVGSVWGWPAVFEIFILSGFAGGILLIGTIATNPPLLKRVLIRFGHIFIRLFNILKNLVVLSIGKGRIGDADMPKGGARDDDGTTKKRSTVPYGVAIAMGASVWLVLNSSGHPLKNYFF